MKHQTGSFTAIGDDGRRYTVNIFTDFDDAGNLIDPGAVIEGLKELRTSSGQSVNRKAKGEYQIVQTGITLRSSDANAP